MGAVGCPRAARAGAALDVLRSLLDHQLLGGQACRGARGFGAGPAVREAEGIGQDGGGCRGDQLQARLGLRLAGARQHHGQLPGPQVSYSGSRRCRITTG